MCTTRHSLESFLKLKTVLDKSASSLSDCYVSILMVWCGCGAQRFSDTPQIGRATDASGSDMKSIRLCAQLTHERSSLLFCSLVR